MGFRKVLILMLILLGPFVSAQYPQPSYANEPSNSVVLNDFDFSGPQWSHTSGTDFWIDGWLAANINDPSFNVDMLVSNDATAPVSPNEVLEFRETFGSTTSGGGPNVQYFFDDEDEIYASFNFKLSPGFRADWGPNQHKLFVVEPNNVVTSVIWWHYNLPAGDQLYLDVGTGSTGGYLNSFRPAGRETLTPITTGDWHEVELHLKRNGDGQDLVEWWLDGVLQGRHSDLAFQDPRSGVYEQFDHYKYAAQMGGGGSPVPQDQSIYFDHSYLSSPSNGSPSCSCGSWSDNTCGAGSCSSTQMQQTRTCTPSACSIETQCVVDASCTPSPICGDLTCNGNETCSTCSQDCGTCGPVCGDSSCNGDETCSSCPGDCGACPPSSSTGPGDVNNDSMVDLADLVMMTINLGNSGFDPITDINGDGRVNIFDLVVVARNYGNDYSVQQPSGLVAYYDFDEGSGSTLTDLSGNGNSGNIIGTPNWDSGVSGTALNFDGSSNYVEALHSASLDITNNITVMAWVNTPGDGYDNIIIKGNLGTSYGFFLNNRTFEYDLGGWSGISSESVPANTWTHVALTYDGSNVRVYRDGQLVISNPQTGIIPSNTQTLQIGAAAGGALLIGLMDDVRIYNRALTQAEIQADMNS